MAKHLFSRRRFLTISAMTAAACALDWRKFSALASQVGPKEDYPVAVIGAGLGGLTCAAYLAKAGFPVTVVEQHSIPGGYATAFDRAAGRFTFDVSLHGTSINNNGTARLLEELGVLQKIELVELPEVYRLKAPGLDIIVPQKDPEAYVRLLSRHFPEEAKGIHGFVKAMLDLNREVDKLDQKNGKFFKPLFPIQYRSMWKIRNQTLADLLNEHVQNQELKNTLAGLWGYYGLPPSKLSAFYYANATGGYLKNGSYYIKERSQQLSNALADCVKENGGRLIYDTAVEKINTINGEVAGVVLTDGNILPAKAVASNASALTTFNKLLPAAARPTDYLRQLERYRPSISCFLVWLGLNQPVNNQIMTFSTFVSTGIRPDEDYAIKLKGDVEKGSYGVAVYDNIYPGYSAEGTATLQLIFLCGYEPWRQFEADYQAGNKKAYNQEKQRWADILIQRAEKDLIPGLSAMIALKEAATPLTCWRYTGNPQGAIYGFEQSMDNAFMQRLENRTPVKGLYLASAWGNPGGGYVGVMRGGQNASKDIIEDFAH